MCIVLAIDLMATQYSNCVRHHGLKLGAVLFKALQQPFPLKMDPLNIAQLSQKSKLKLQLFAEMVIISFNPPTHTDKYEGDKIEQN